MESPIKLREYQKEVDRAQDEFMSAPGEFRAIVCACTGSGKTVNFTKLIIDEALKRQSDGCQMKVLIAQPRLALSEEQQKRMHNLLSKFDLTWEFSGFHTGNIVESSVRKSKSSRIPLSTTSASKIKSHILSSDEDLYVAWTTYHSLNKIRHLDFDLIICDEAHYLAYGKFHSNVKFFPKETKIIFYTATPVGVIDESEPRKIGMCDENLFGRVIAEVPPKMLIPDRYIVPPVIYFMAAITKKDGDVVDYAQLIGKAYGHQLEQVSPKFNHKMLVAMPGVKMFDDIMKNRETISVEAGCDVDVYCVHANGHSKNGSARGLRERQDLINDFAENPGPAVILHYDTLSEGMDIDGIGGVLFLRRFLGKVKSLQTMGRACRPAREDINADGTIKESRIKTNAILTLSEVDGLWESEKKLKEWAAVFAEGGYDRLWDYVNPDTLVVGSDPEDERQIKELVKKHIDSVWFDELAGEELEQLRLDLDLPERTGGLGSDEAQPA